MLDNTLQVENTSVGKAIKINWDAILEVFVLNRVKVFLVVIWLVKSGNVHPFRGHNYSDTGGGLVFEVQELGQLFISVFQSLSIHLTSIDLEDSMIKWKFIENDDVVLSCIKLNI